MTSYNFICEKCHKELEQILLVDELGTCVYCEGVLK